MSVRASDRTGRDAPAKPLRLDGPSSAPRRGGVFRSCDVVLGSPHSRAFLSPTLPSTALRFFGQQASGVLTNDGFAGHEHWRPTNFPLLSGNGHGGLGR